MKLKANLRSRNIGINAYVGALAITLVGSFAALYIIHVALDAPFSQFFSPAAYDISSSL